MLLVSAFISACSDKPNTTNDHGTLTVSVAPEFSEILRKLSDDFSVRYSVKVNLDIVESGSLWLHEANSDFLIGVEREKALRAAGVANSGWRTALWISEDVVLAVRKNETFSIRKARDLQQPIINPVAIPAQREEVGRRAVELFDYWKIRSIMQPRIRIARNSAAAVKMLISGEARAAVLPAHIVAGEPALKQVFSFSALAHQRLRKAAMRCSRAGKNSAADEFERVLVTEGVAALMKSGYKAADSDF